MNTENCENILMSLMAALDGEETEFSPEKLNAHLADCAGCRREIEQMKSTFALLEKQERRVENVDLWSRIEPRLEAKISLLPFAFLGVFLFVYKLAEMLPENGFGFALKIAPVVAVAALFVFLKENPFKINTELILEK